MTEPSYGSVLTCIFVTSFIMLYLIILNQKKNFIVRYGAGAYLALTLFLILRAVLPCNFSFSHNILSKIILPPFFDAITFKIFGMVSLMDLFVSIWIIGFLVQFLRFCIKQYQFCQYIKTLDTTTAYNDILKRITEKHKKNKQIRLIITSDIKIPFTTGLIKPVILLPDTNLSEKETEYILSHEAEHLFRHDLWKCLFYEIMACVYWWNPLAYKMKQQFTAAVELSNDFSIVKNMDKSESLDYLSCLVKVAKKQPSPVKKPVLCFSENEPSLLMRRTDFIINRHKIKKDKFYFINLSVITAILIASFLFVVEPYYTIPQEILDTTMSLDIDHTFFIKNETHYDVYFYNKYVCPVNTLRSFPGYTVYKNKEEAKKHEKIN
ncbi:M56 family metallopeptidase [bacterium D16-51]|nr:M56 family metallopeptidase [bacterium D16-59]RKI61588.1 M56 family metallopeptidase [bacterium D16-51]